jgi:hypothetical protein
LAVSEPWRRHLAAFPREVKEEFVRLLCLLPLLGFSLRAPPSEILTCSDASEGGRGVCRATSLTPSGLSEFERERGRRTCRTRKGSRVSNAMNLFKLEEDVE